MLCRQTEDEPCGFAVEAAYFVVAESCSAVEETCSVVAVQRVVA